ncbi:MAG: cytochrome C biogenesis protein [Chitinophagaceae bacterium]|nr:MAG: cytochrome C biogenesis protein [Chitinophagaceae bacterium]
MDIQYAGEALMPGYLGRFFVVLAFVAALFAAVSYFFSEKSEVEDQKNSWKWLGRIGFGLHGIGVFGIVGVLFYLINNHHFEYIYVWKHSSLELPKQYLLACFWEGQEGSFLLWSFWHVILGFVLIFSTKKWEAPVMMVVAITQLILASMLLGIHVFDYKVGSNPFILLREEMDAPIFALANYLDFIEDGNGLNPLLQNYWMVIHPPVLFVGFAASVVPFAYSIAALWRRDYKSWVKPVLPWAIFTSFSLGMGILMGGAWAYESLSFGGFWAWDPVENASLVPWLTIIAGIHALVIYKSSGYALKSTFVLLIITFILILYSSFLTRSGILGDTSVHSFTDLGMSGQLLTFIFVFLIMGIALLIYRWKELPEKKDEEKFSSREFWMFVGILVLILASVQITITTSIPVFNAIFGTNWAPPTDVIGHYNSIQIWVGIIVLIFTGFTQFLRYKKTSASKATKSIAIGILISTILTVLIAIGARISGPDYLLLLFAAIYAIVGNLHYMIKVIKGKILVSGGSVAHLGFGFLILGVLISNYNNEVISLNRSGIDFGDSFDDESKLKNILLRRDMPVPMGPYEVTYLGDSTSGPNIYYKVNYKRIDKETGQVLEEFNLFPNAQINPEMGGLISNPSTRHYLTRDIFTHVTSVPDKTKIEELKDEWEEIKISLGDTFFTARSFAILENINPQPTHPNYEKISGDLPIGARIRFRTLEGAEYLAEPLFVIRGNRVIFVEDEVMPLSIQIRLQDVLPEEEKFVIAFWEEDFENDFIIMKAMIFPYINLLWLGCILMLLGFLLSWIKRYTDNRRDQRKLKSA